DVKIRGTAAHVYEKYLQLARDASSAGDRVTAENYLQHAEHYYRILMAQGGLPQQQQQQQGGQQQNYGGQHGGQQGYGNGDGRTPMKEGYPQRVGSAPSFSLNDAAEDGEEGDEAA